MKRTTARTRGLMLYCLLMLCIPVILYCLVQEWLLFGILSGMVMFTLFMGMLWLSENEEESREVKDDHLASRSLDG